MGLKTGRPSHIPLALAACIFGLLSPVVKNHFNYKSKCISLIKILQGQFLSFVPYYAIIEYACLYALM